MNKDKLVQIALMLSFFTGIVLSQEYPFPQNIKYPYGFMPATFTTTNYEKWYNRFKSDNKLQSCNGGIAPQTDQGTKVEAMGWAMIIAAYMGDKETFDGLYTFYKSKIQRHGMMAWLTSCGGVSDAGSASDGDLDVAFSLVVASWQWGDTYKSEAIDVITTVKKLITDCEGTSVVVGGYGSDGGSPYGGCSRTDISYYTPAFFREFAKLTDDQDWEKLADDTYIVLNNSANDKTGLVPDWQTWDGKPSGNYGYDACRVPWRMALDYLWNGNEEAKKWCTTISDWAYGVGPGKIGSGYNLDGSGGGGWPGMSYVGGFAVAAMVHSQEVSDAFGKQIAGMNYDSYWYHSFLGNCYMLAMSGNMWRPGLDSVSTGNDDETNVLEKTLQSSLTLTRLANRELAISGMLPGTTVSLTTLRGQLVKKAVVMNASDVSFDLSTVKSGCYMIIIRDNQGMVRKGQVISVQ